MQESELFAKLKELEIEAKQNNEPICGEEKGKILFDLVQKYNPKSILELGTCVGYSGTILASQGAQLTTIDRHREALNRAEEVFTWFGISATIFFGDALDVLEKIQDQKFDLVFLDHMKAQYEDAFNIVKTMAPVIIIDNTTSPKCQSFINKVKQEYNFEEFDDMLVVSIVD